MKVRLARTAGFCMGVSRAMELALSTVHAQEGEIATLGPLIHNPQALELLRSKGVQVLDQVPQEHSQHGGTVIIRAHGVPPAHKHGLKKAGFFKVVDGTCPRVVRVQAIIRKAARQQKDVVIVGDVHHPEVQGLLGHAGDRGQVVSGPGEVAGLPELGQVVAVAQTTQSAGTFNQVVAQLQDRFGQVEVHHTICEATSRRQAEVARLAAQVGCIVVVGGRDSGNTKRLAQAARAAGARVQLVENEDQIDEDQLQDFASVGLTAGASTPNWVIKRVLRRLGAIRSNQESRLRFWTRRVFRFMVLSQLLVALGAAGMSLAACALEGIGPTWPTTGVAFFYIYAMHLLNQYLDKEAGQYNDPDRALFLTSHRGFLIGSGITATAAALILCLTLGLWPFLLVTAMSVLGLLYSVPVVPRRLEAKIGILRLKDIPGSKTLSASLAWAFIVAVLPAVSLDGAQTGGVVLAFLYTLALVLIRCALFDILDVQGDLMVGKETIPIVLGEKRSRRILRKITAALAVLLALAPLVALAPSVAWWLLLPLAALAFMQHALTKAWLMPGAIGEGLTDLCFWLAGAVTLIWLWAQWAPQLGAVLLST